MVIILLYSFSRIILDLWQLDELRRLQDAHRKHAIFYVNEQSFRIFVHLDFAACYLHGTVLFATIPQLVGCFYRCGVRGVHLRQDIAVAFYLDLISVIGIEDRSERNFHNFSISLHNPITLLAIKPIADHLPFLEIKRIYLRPYFRLDVMPAG